jgi:hypothetical protein
MNQVLSWSLKVWITSVVLAPTLDLLVYSLLHPRSGFPQGSAQFILVMVIFSIVFTFPCCFILWRTAHVIDYYFNNIIHKKLLLSVIGATLAIAPFYVYFKNEPIKTDIELKSLYCATVVLGIWLYRIEPKTDKRTNEASINI